MKIRIILLITALLVVVSDWHQMDAQAQRRRTGIAAGHQYSPPGRMIDIGGYKLHVNCDGKASKGKPTVILLHGLGGFSFDWALVQPRVARFARVCSYDRAGQAWSDPGRKPRGPLKSATELRALLTNAGIKPPYVLVGHSLGGIIARVFASQYPNDVGGIVLVDSTHEDQYLWLNGKIVRPRLMTDQEWDDLKRPKAKQASFSDSKEPTLTRQSPADKKLDPPFDKLPLEVQSIRLWALSLPRTTAIDEGGDVQDFRRDFIEAYSLTRANKGKHPLGNLPLIVVTANSPRDPDYTQEQHDWNRKLQVELAGLSRDSKHIITRKGEHYIQLEEPEQVTNAIREVFEAVGHRRTLRGSN